MASRWIKLSTELVQAAEREGTLQNRSTPKQIESWAELGKAVGRWVSPEDVVAVVQGLKTLKVEPVPSEAVKPADVFSALEHSRQSGRLSKEVTTARFSYQSSRPQRPGFLEYIDSNTGERRVGQLREGEFVEFLG